MIDWIRRLVGLEPRPVYVVQLEVHDHRDEPVSSFAAITTRNFQEALGWAAQLERDNLWVPEGHRMVIEVRKAV